jgi:hypothetical protein
MPATSEPRPTPCGSSRPPSSSPPPAGPTTSAWPTATARSATGGHVLTKTRRYSTTFRQLRQARQDWRRQPRAAQGPDARQLVDEDHESDRADIVVERSWRYAGSGYLDADEAALAMTAAALARSR